MNETMAVIGLGLLLLRIIGIALAEGRLARRSRQLDLREAELAAAWAAMERQRRLDQALWRARLAMRTGALRQLRDPLA